eukprot:jgi/Hompol1/1106/HPOL_003167-RA
MSRRSAVRWAAVAPLLRKSKDSLVLRRLQQQQNQQQKPASTRARSSSSSKPSQAPSLARTRTDSSDLDLKRPDARSELSVRTLTVDPSSHQSSLLNFLVKEARLSRLAVRSKLDDSLIWLSGSAHAKVANARGLNAKTVLMAGDRVNIAYRIKDVDTKAEEESLEDAVESIVSRVLYKDDDIFVIDKEHGLASQGGSKVDLHLDQLVTYLEKDPSKAPKLNTSGAMIIARSKAAAARVSDMFKEPGRIQRKYLALLIPSLSQRNAHKQNDAVEIVTGIVPNGRTPPYERMDMVEWFEGDETRNLKSPEGHPIKKAITRMTVLQSSAFASAVFLESITGRKHQLRLHCAKFVGSFILGDYKYGAGCTKAFQRFVANAKNVPMHLHLYQIVLKDWYGDGVDLSVRAGLP